MHRFEIPTFSGFLIAYLSQVHFGGGTFKIRTYLLCIVLLHIKPPAAFSEFYLRGRGMA